jgi:glycerophosphoryl diester phosphodiesterase
VTDVFAHRGLHVKERENTLASFRAAVALGVDGVELDVRRTRDGVLVVHHDPAIESVPIAQTERSALPDYVPTLEEALTARGRPGERGDQERPRGARVLRRTRRPRSPRPDDDRRCRQWTERVIISCFDLATCAYVRSTNREIPVAWLLWDVALGDALVQAHLLGFTAVNPYFSTVDEEVVTRARDLKLDVNVWTVNSAEDLERMVALDVACIITDDPALARAVVTRTSPTGADR